MIVDEKNDLIASVILPYYNQFDEIEQVLKGFSNQSLSKSKYEIIIVDDGSLIPIYEIVHNYARIMKIIYVRQSLNKGRSYTRNHGVHYAQGEVLIFNDADRIPDYDFIEQHIKALSMNNMISIGSIKEIYLPVSQIKDDFRNFARDSIYFSKVKHLFDEYGNTDSSVPWIATFSGNMALKKALINDFFDIGFSTWGFEHFEFGYRLYENNFKFILNYSAINYHIAHHRDNMYYENNIQMSFEYFYSKHTNIDVLLFRDFILGYVSLQEYEIRIFGEKQWMKRTSKNIYNKLINW